MCGSIFTSILSVFNAWMLRRGHDKVDKLGTTLDEVRTEVNGKMAELVSTTGSEQRAIGNLEGKAEAKAEAAQAKRK